MKNIIRSCIVFFAIPLLAPSWSPAESPVPIKATALSEMVMQRDDAYGWQICHRGQFDGCEFLQLNLTSQRWQGVTWRHTLIVMRPPKVASDQKHALMLIDGGSWNADWDDAGPGPLALPRQAQLLASLARDLEAPVAIIRQIPFQPMMGGLREDALIAATLTKYYQTGDKSWPLLPAMARAASTAIDAVVEVSQQQWDLKLDSFTVTGASKRGWTTYLLGACDQRVKAIAPMVIDMLNLEPQMRHQLDSWGAYSQQIEDYTKLGLQKSLGTPAGDELMSLIDPYQHRDRMTMPKLILLGTNDPYWPVDASRFYFDNLPQPRSLLNIPNNGHGLNDIPRMVGSIAALHRSVETGIAMPTWQSQLRNDQQQGAAIDAWSTQKPSRVYGWVARSPTRDFRGARWNAKSISVDSNGHWQLPLASVDTEFVAGMIEAQYDGPSIFPLSITTGVHVVPDLPVGSDSGLGR